MPQYDSILKLSTAQHVANASANSTYEIDFGMSSPTPDVGSGGKFGAHIVITQAYTNATPTHQIWIMHGPTSGNTKLIGRYFTGTQMGVLNAHYFIPCPPGTLYEFAKLRYVCSSTGAYGKVTAWFGPDEDGTI
jgi:hypothetical protein